MLQQTQVSRVVDYYGEFLNRFPTLADVARARPARVTEAWDGLGYYARARNLHKLAKQITDNGRSPANTLALGRRPNLRALPGIGAYTAGAVSSFAYERRAALVDTNVARVLERVFAPGTQVKTTSGQRTVWSIAESILPRTGRTTWTHNQALMELGALVCTARSRPLRPLPGAHRLSRGAGRALIDERERRVCQFGHLMAASKLHYLAHGRGADRSLPPSPACPRLPWKTP